MTQASRILYAAAAALLRALAWLPLGLAEQIERLADVCERRARGPPMPPSR